MVYLALPLSCSTRQRILLLLQRLACDTLYRVWCIIVLFKEASGSSWKLSSWKLSSWKLPWELPLLPWNIALLPVEGVLARQSSWDQLDVASGSGWDNIEAGVSERRSLVLPR